MKKYIVIALIGLMGTTSACSSSDNGFIVWREGGYPIVDTNQSLCYNNTAEMTCPSAGNAFYAQDAQYVGNQLSYTDNGNGTVTDNITELMWQHAPDFTNKLTYDEAVADADSFSLGGHSDWRLPTIKELYSLMLFSGADASGCATESACPGLMPFIDTTYFDFAYGDTDSGERLIDAQYVSSTAYVSTVFSDEAAVFGVNFADGRIKGYPQANTFFVRYVRDNSSYAENSLNDVGSGRIVDARTELIWMQNDSGRGMTWEDALAYCEDYEVPYLDDWRLPSVKELQSIVDYSRSPDTTDSAAIDPFFNTTSITNEAGQVDYPYFWSGTTHATWTGGGEWAAYVCFGRCMGYMNGQWMDVHGAGAQRSDPKSGDPANYPTGHGSQGDAVRILNYVRCVRGL